MRVNMHEAKSNLSRLVAALENKEVDEVEIARAGRVVARIVLARPGYARQAGLWKGQVKISPEFDDLPDATAAAFRGEQ
jgi:antitoxin (DNA-binding transcriptional repressor) of toxin-antitoxin stability system